MATSPGRRTGPETRPWRGVPGMACWGRGARRGMMPVAAKSSKPDRRPGRRRDRSSPGRAREPVSVKIFAAIQTAGADFSQVECIKQIARFIGDFDRDSFRRASPLQAGDQKVAAGLGRLVPGGGEIVEFGPFIIGGDNATVADVEMVAGHCFSTAPGEVKQ